MIKMQAVLKKWGNSMGLRLSKKDAEKEKLKEGEEVELMIIKKTNPLQKTFGIAKFSRPTHIILKEVDKEAWDE